ncbi:MULTISPECIES: glycosyltransferase [Vibrio]|uniref:glycosyltransferase n=1 Tax=Vibrio TaxID=662 RepID=UPI000B8EBA88|nr:MULTISPECIES: glycosyltransferase [Vibrio]MBY7668175.1 glycosyltransferase [Vibrio anguillarum]NAX45366.1 glycosyltransferase [Vibrio sp. V25_P4S6T154]OXX47686.1 glycosyl transferase family 2 [Vibrio sp. V17_P4S1T151]OXX61425.1 glycosyl transferase family 2 [Vibrio sp. V15_P4S5T153]OXX70624.1 glycosyl transferase family 2 [Vibrio sp. V20_P4S3T152]
MSKNSQQRSVATNPIKSVVVVLGMHRSGTSALTKALQVMGVSLSENLMPEGEFNPKGHWEDMDVVSINDKLLAHYGHVWFSATQPQISLDDDYVQLLLEEAVAMVNQRVQQFPLWGFKDPRTSRLLCFWLEVLQRANVVPKFVYALRNPLDIVRSLARRDGLTHRQGYLLWWWHTLPNLSLLRSQPVAWVSFNQLLTQPQQVITQLQQHLSLASLPEEDVATFCDSFIEPSLSHSCAQLSDLYQDEQHFEPVLTLYSVLEKLSRDELTLEQWLDDGGAVQLQEAFQPVFMTQWALLAEQLNQSALKNHALLYHANIRNQQLVDDSRNKQAELQNAIKTLQQELIDKDQELVVLNGKLIETSNACLTQQKAQEQLELIAKEAQAKLLKELQEREQHTQALLGAITEIHHSTSWKITAPIRAIRPILSMPLRIVTRGVGFVRYHGGLKNTCRKAYRVYQRDGLSALLLRGQYQVIQAVEQTGEPLINYGQWLEKYGQLSVEQTQMVSARIASLSERPKISVLMPVYNPPLDYLCEAIESVQAQLYPEWELCIADDASPNQAVRDLLREYAQQDSRIRVVEREQNGHISLATNSALALASGDFIALMDHDDTLANDALYWVAEAIIANPQAVLIYSDEDKLSSDGQTRYDPNFKPHWNPELLRSQNCISHLGVYKTDLAKALGGFRIGFEGAQDWDFALRYSETLSPDQVVHIPRILYHWRAIEGSTAIDGDEKPYALTAGLQAVQEHCDRIHIQAQVVEHPERHYARVKYAIPTPQPMVSMIIPTRNGLDVLSVCIDSILAKTTYSNYEIIIVDNGSDCADTLAYLDKLQQENDNIVLLHDDSPFNYSALNNKAAAIAKGEILALVNNDVEVITPDWLAEMVGHAIQPQNGAVGARLWYPDDTLQHGGVILVGGVAGHAHKHLPKGMPGYACRAIVAQNYSAVTAACLVVRKAVFELVGGLNETDLTVAFNDIDFCLKVQEAGYFNVWTPYAELYHYESKTRGFEDTPEKEARFAKEVAYMRNRWGHRLDADPCYNPNLTMAREDFSLADARRV